MLLNIPQTSHFFSTFPLLQICYAKAEPCQCFQESTLTNLYDDIKNKGCFVIDNKPDGNFYWDKIMKAQNVVYGKCQKPAETGSFGNCRKQERISAVLNYDCRLVCGNCTQTTTMVGSNCSYPNIFFYNFIISL